MQKNFDINLTKPEVNDEYNDIDIISIVGEPPVLQEQLFSFIFGNAGNIRKHENELRAWKIRYNRTKEREDQAKADKQQLQLLLQNQIQQNSQVLAKTEEKTNQMAQLLQKVHGKEQNTASTGDDFLSAILELKETIEMQAKILSATNTDNFNFFINSDSGKTYCDRLGWNDKFKRNNSLEKCVDYNIILRNKVLQALTGSDAKIDYETEWNRIIEEVKTSSMNMLLSIAGKFINLPQTGYDKSLVYTDILTSLFMDYLENSLGSETLAGLRIKKDVKNSLQYISRVVRIPGDSVKPRNLILQINDQLTNKLKSYASYGDQSDNGSVRSTGTSVGPNGTGGAKKVNFEQVVNPEPFFHRTDLEQKLFDCAAGLLRDQDLATACYKHLQGEFSAYLVQEQDQTEEYTPVKTPTSTKSCQSTDSNVSDKNNVLQLAEDNAKVNMVLTAPSLKTTGTLFKSPQMKSNTDENKSPSESNKGSTPLMIREITG